MKRELAREVARLAWPVILQGLLSTAVFFTDRLLLGSYSDAALGSMQISGPVLWSMAAVLGAFSAGTMAIIGRSVGAKDPERVRDTLVTSLWLSVVVGGLMCVAGLFGKEHIASVMGGGPGTTQELRDLAIAYMGVVFLMAPIAHVGATGIVALQAGGDTRSPMWAVALAGVVNLGVSWVLIFGHLGAPELGIYGAAIGTVASYAVSYTHLTLPTICSV